MKTNKSYTKRIRVTRKGKLMTRHTGQNHYNAKESRAVQTRKRRGVAITMNRELRARFLAGK
jgi:ribosomal protein L35